MVHSPERSMVHSQERSPVHLQERLLVRSLGRLLEDWPVHSLAHFRALRTSHPRRQWASCPVRSRVVRVLPRCQGRALALREGLQRVADPELEAMPLLSPPVWMSQSSGPLKKYSKALDGCAPWPRRWR